MKSDKTELRSLWVSGGSVSSGDRSGDEMLSLMLTGTNYGKGKYGREVLLAVNEHMKDRIEPAKYVVTTQNNKPILEHKIIGSTHYSLFISGGEQYFSVTGSIEEVISKCTKLRKNGHDVPMSKTDIGEILRDASDCLKTASSIVAVAVRVSPYNNMKRLSVLTSDLTFVGFIAMETPAHPKLPSALAYLRDNRIPFFFFTDGSGEDINFARKLGILKSRDDLVTSNIPESAIADILAEGSFGGAVYVDEESKIPDVLRCAKKAGKRLVYIGGDDHITDAGFAVAYDSPVAGSGAYLNTHKGGDMSTVIEIVRSSQMTVSRLNNAYIYLFISSVLRAVYSLTLLFGMPYVYTSVILAWGLVLDGIVSLIIVTSKKKSNENKNI